MRNISDKSCGRNQRTHFVFGNFFPPENRAVYEILWQDVERGREHMTLRAGILTLRLQTHIHTICNTYRFSTATMVARTLCNVTYIACLVASLFRAAWLTSTENYGWTVKQAGAFIYETDVLYLGNKVLYKESRTRVMVIALWVLRLPSLV
jgi:hypothetical protein